MCELLTYTESKVVQVALNGLENILKVGEMHNVKPNPYAVLIEECYGKQISILLLWFLCIQSAFLIVF